MSEGDWSEVDPLCPPEPKDLKKHFCEANIVLGNPIKSIVLHCLYKVSASCTRSVQYHETLTDMCKSVYAVRLECMGEGHLIGSSISLVYRRLMFMQKVCRNVCKVTVLCVDIQSIIN